MMTLRRLCGMSLLLVACNSSEQNVGHDAGGDHPLADGGKPQAADGGGSALTDGGASSAPEQLRSALTRVSDPSTANVPALAAGNTAFAFDMLRQLAADQRGKNLVFSPYSISTALGMTYAGARGTTQAEMKSALHFELAEPALHEAFNSVDRTLATRGTGQLGADRTPFKLNVSNALWQQRGLPVEAPFLDTLALHYGAGVFVMDFRNEPEPSRKLINGWVAQRTEQLIPELLPERSITSGTALVLTNTVYFNGSWQTKFDKSMTRDAPFQRLDGSSVQVPTMHAGFTGGITYAKGTGYEAVALPYASEELAFVAVLPVGGSYETLEASASATWFSQLQAALAPSSVQLALPKLDTKTASPLKPALQALGMRQPFEANADFSGITSASVAIDSVVHQAVVKVFEDGTIAAAATGVIIGPTGIPSFEHVVRFDRPFLYAVVDRPTGQILFLGRVLDPSAG